ncbi:hypothetical protein QQZ08_004416 [Neonectria magnoliae]|uniref:F-box domain-containing protein n=1 Tax=Neonectria magnoliae TaxID=2732573 RepID=A0ABR1I610_9HYPO
MEPSRANVLSQPRLPLEIILLVVESLAPSNPDTILPPSHEATKCLLALTRVSSAVSHLASKLLWQSCPHINSLRKLRDFGTALRCLAPNDVRRPANLFLGLYHGDDNPLSEAWPWYTRVGHAHRGAELSLDDRHLRSSGSVIGALVRTILLEVAPTLRRLVINMPLAAVDSQHDGDAMLGLLRPGFEALVNLEEFTSIGDSFSFRSLNRDAPEVWASSWPKLRRLSLGNASTNFSPVINVQSLDMLVISSRNAFHLLMTGIKGNLMNALRRDREARNQATRKPFTLVYVDSFCASWTDLRPQRSARVLLADVGAELKESREDHSSEDVYLTLRWMQQKALLGMLWDSASAGSGDWAGCTPWRESVSS